MEININGCKFEVDRLPDICPICNKYMKPQELYFQQLENTIDKGYNVIFKCPCVNCQNLFIARYRNQGLWGRGEIMLTDTYPQRPKKKNFDETISALSPEFCNIYNEAFSAEQYKLMLICGPGYRKALEFLIKDYAIANNAEKEEDIKKMLLSDCINKYVEDRKIKVCASRAVWLGNDETHYVRKWEEKDVQDMKRLIELTVRWIESEIMTVEYMEDMVRNSK